MERGISLNDLPLSAYQEVCPVFEEDIYEAVSLKTCVDKRKTTGAPGREAMQEMIDACHFTASGIGAVIFQRPPTASS